MHKATFFITTARSGTQWLAESLGNCYRDALVVTHEPIGYRYRPKIYLRADDRLDELRALPPVAAHLDEIHEILRHRSYVEVGFPCFATAPLLGREFGDRLRLVQLIRHPVRVAASLVTHYWYQSARKDSLPDDIELEPQDPGVVQSDYLDRWPTLTPYEKALFYWTEVHLFAQEVEVRHPGLPFHRIRFEDLIGDEVHLRRLAAFLEVEYREDWSRTRELLIDRFRLRTTLPIDASRILAHPRAMQLVHDFGYELSAIDLKSMHERYAVHETSDRVRPTRLPRRVRRPVRRFMDRSRPPVDLSAYTLSRVLTAANGSLEEWIVGMNGILPESVAVATLMDAGWLVTAVFSVAVCLAGIRRARVRQTLN
jgi:hypothetical protein